MANEQNLRPQKKGEPAPPGAGRPKGTPNRKTILKWLLFEADIDDLGVIEKKPEWWDKVKPKTLYETMSIAMALKASSGDTHAYTALNKAMGELHIHEGGDKPVSILGGASVRQDNGTGEDSPQPSETKQE